MRQTITMQTQPLESNSTNLIKLRSSQPESLKAMIQSDLNHRLQDLESGLQQTQARLKQFETQYQWSTEQFVDLFTNDQLQHSEDFDEWLEIEYGSAKKKTHKHSSTRINKIRDGR